MLYNISIGEEHKKASAIIWGDTENMDDFLEAMAHILHFILFKKRMKISTSHLHARSYHLVIG